MTSSPNDQVKLLVSRIRQAIDASRLNQHERDLIGQLSAEEVDRQIAYFEKVAEPVMTRLKDLLDDIRAAQEAGNKERALHMLADALTVAEQLARGLRLTN
jgi:hypothetical protein